MLFRLFAADTLSVNIMISQPIRDFAEFVGFVEALPLVGGFNIFRGQDVKGNLLPSIARRDPTQDTTATERLMMNQLGLQAAAYLPSNNEPLDRLVAAQHFGMKTRLLDWTSNPLAALWFAFANPVSTAANVYVYALDTDGLLYENAYETSDPFSLTSTKIFQPRLNNPRVLAQHGYFSLHCFSPRNQRWVRLETHEEIGALMVEMVLPASDRQEMLKSLDRHGVSSRTLFPDLSGVCTHLNWQYAP